MDPATGQFTVVIWGHSGRLRPGALGFAAEIALFMIGLQIQITASTAKKGLKCRLAAALTAELERVPRE